MKKILIIIGSALVVLLAIVGILAIVVKINEAPNPQKYPIVFKIHAPEAHSVFVTGSFNGWQKVEYRLEKKDEGNWEVKIPIARGRYEYKFIVDSLWTHDVDNPIKVPIMLPYSGYNSVLEVPGNQISKKEARSAMPNQSL